MLGAKDLGSWAVNITQGCSGLTSGWHGGKKTQDHYLKRRKDSGNFSALLGHF